jgi:hypothetical protein
LEKEDFSIFLYLQAKLKINFGFTHRESAQRQLRERRWRSGIYVWATVRCVCLQAEDCLQNIIPAAPA